MTEALLDFIPFFSNLSSLDTLLIMYTITLKGIIFYQLKTQKDLSNRLLDLLVAKNKKLIKKVCVSTKKS